MQRQRVNGGSVEDHARVGGIRSGHKQVESIPVLEVLHPQRAPREGVRPYMAPGVPPPGGGRLAPAIRPFGARLAACIRAAHVPDVECIGGHGLRVVQEDAVISEPLQTRGTKVNLQAPRSATLCRKALGETQKAQVQQNQDTPKQRRLTPGATLSGSALCLRGGEGVRAH